MSSRAPLASQARTPHLTVLLAAFTAFAALAAPLAAEEAAPALETVAVAEGVYFLTGRGGNVGVVVGDDAVFLIDDQYDHLAPAVVEAVKAITPKPIRFVVNTHWHGDHTGGNALVQGAGAIVFAHENVRRRMSAEQVDTILERTTPPSPVAALPVVTFTDSVTVHLAGRDVRSTHPAPAHTDGDAIVFLPDVDVVHFGDVVFNHLYPFVDLSAGGSIEGVIAAVEKVLAETGPATKYIPGHGPLATRDDLAQYLAMLRGSRAAVAPLVAAGKTYEETLAAKPTAAWDEAWAWGFITVERWVRIVWEDVRRNPPTP